VRVNESQPKPPRSDRDRGDRRGGGGRGGYGYGRRDRGDTRW